MKRFLLYLFVICLAGASIIGYGRPAGGGYPGPARPDSRSSAEPGYPDSIGPVVLLAPLSVAERSSDTFHVRDLRQQEVGFSDTFWRYLYVKFGDVRLQLFLVPLVWHNSPLGPERKPVDSAYVYCVLDKSDTIAALLKNLPEALDGQEKVPLGADSASLSRLSAQQRLKYDSLRTQGRLKREKILAGYPLTDELRNEYRQFLAILTKSQGRSPYILMFNDKAYADLGDGLKIRITDVRLTDVKDVAPPPPIPPPPPPPKNGGN